MFDEYKPKGDDLFKDKLKEAISGVLVLAGVIAMILILMTWGMPK